MQFGNIKSFTMLCNITAVYIQTLSFYSPHFPAKPEFMSSTPCSSLSNLTTFSLLLSPFLPILLVSTINANHWNDRKLEFFLIECESYSLWVLLDSLQPHEFYTPWNSLGQNTGMGSFPLLQGIFGLSTYCKTNLENSCFYFFWGSLWVSERTV